MKIKLFLSIIFFACVGFSQNCSFTIFNNSGQQFFVIMNGIKQNSIPQTNVKVSGMSLGAYSVKVIFADGKTGDLDKNVYFTEGGDHLARILIKGKKRKLQYFGVSDGSQPIPSGTSPIVYRPSDQYVYSDVPVSSPPEPPVSNPISTTTTNTTSNTQFQTGTTITENGQAFGTSTTVSDPNNSNGNIGVNININVNDPMGNLNGGGVQTGINGSQTTTSSTTTSSTTTTSTTSSNQSGQISTNTNNLNTNNQTATSLNTNSKNCNSYINNIDEVVKTIQNETFDADKRSYIENDLKMYCVSADQSYRIVKALTFDSDRIDMCIFLYDRMIDKANGKRLLELLTFDSDKETFNAYMKAH